MATFSVKDFNSTEIFFYAPSGTGVVGDPFYAGTIITGALPAGSNAIGSITSLAQFAGQAITLGAGAVGAGTLRLTLASDDPAVASLGAMDDWDESDRAKVNLIVGQAGITAGAGAVAANTPRITLASDDPVVAALAAIDGHIDGIEGSVDGVEASLTSIDGKLPAAGALADNAGNPTTTGVASYAMVFDGSTWDRWQGAVNVTLLGGQAITLGAGAVAGGTQRVTLASDDPAVASLGAMDDWDESDRAKVNVIVGQAGITAGAGAVAANTPRITLASDDPAVASLASLLAAAGGALTYKRIKISAAASGENTLVAAVASKKIRVLSCFLMATADVSAYFNNATDGGICGDSTNKLSLAAKGGFSLAENKAGWFETGTVNEALRLNLSSAVGVAGCLTYAEV